tara:strand:- start:1205 stop:1354 length:150 start_codon:yes stop_codon:yes gene_type:complete
MRNKIVELILVRNEVVALIEDLGWEYDRMSSSGKEAYDKLTELLEVTDE